MFVFLPQVSVAGLLVAVPIAGLLFGLSMATYAKRSIRKFNLPSWEEIGEPTSKK